MRITILGLGRMGAPMARNLIELGHEVTLWNRTPERAEALAAAGVRISPTVSDAVSTAQVALTMVSGDAAEEAITWGPGGLLEELGHGAIHLCMSTIGVDLSLRLAEAHAAAGQGYVAAPVLGKPSDAVSRRLWILAAGPETQVNRCLVALEALGRGITRVGTRAELAHALKLGANLLTVAMVETLGEVLAFGEKAGFASADYLRLLNLGLLKSPPMDAFGGLMVRRDHEPSDQTLALAGKDLDLILRASQDLGMDLPMVAPLRRQVVLAEEHGLGGLDLTALALVHRPETPRVEPALPQPPPAQPLPAPPKPPPVQSLPARSAPAKPVPPEPPRHLSRAERRRNASARKAGELERRKAAEVPKAPRETPPRPAAPVPPRPSPLPPAPHAEPKAHGEPVHRPRPAAAPAPDPVQAPSPRPGEAPAVDLEVTTHFEVADGKVHAWVAGQRQATPWRSFEEVELAFNEVLFVRIQRTVLLNPQAVEDIRSLFGGRAKVRVTGGMELSATREAAKRLRFLRGE
ncbi:NAD(P)-dependent oxidoreductase [Mesoterricola silvestris]|uniref:HTH LytTR-type domain-containing protein n=1 Tax=Mesoterricola silvestris TaxID=2927979 RepID=A0AA48GQG5_9BACT|nr:NAD(P)-binding domain-containing protein [Mesoterricola silvestris]BDU74234.1 hypothetical protein METEAL_34080 [Mesoterricola silvestris]